MIVILFMILLAVAVLAPWLGADTTDRRSESAHASADTYLPIRTL